VRIICRIINGHAGYVPLVCSAYHPFVVSDIRHTIRRDAMRRDATRRARSVQPLHHTRHAGNPRILRCDIYHHECRIAAYITATPVVGPRSLVAWLTLCRPNGEVTRARVAQSPRISLRSSGCTARYKLASLSARSRKLSIRSVLLRG